MPEREPPKIVAEPCAECPHCGEMVVLKDATWRTHNHLGDRVTGEIICPQCQKAVRVEERLTQ